MVSSSQDLQRLHLMAGDSFGLEYLSPFVQLKDFVRYYFSRFLSNVNHNFDDFTQSELEAYNKRYTSFINKLTSEPNIVLDKTIVPIPKGMINPYKNTVQSLNNLLGKINADIIVHDLTSIMDMMTNRDVTASQTQVFQKTQFEECRVILASLFGKTGLTHSVASHVFVQNEDIAATNTQLLEMVDRFYPLVFKLKELVENIEQVHDALRVEPREQKVIAQGLMSVAYRLSIFSIVMDHVQSMEHGFVGCLTIFQKTSG